MKENFYKWLDAAMSALTQIATVLWHVLLGILNLLILLILTITAWLGRLASSILGFCKENPWKGLIYLYVIAYILIGLVIFESGLSTLLVVYIFAGCLVAGGAMLVLAHKINSADKVAEEVSSDEAAEKAAAEEEKEEDDDEDVWKNRFYLLVKILVVVIIILALLAWLGATTKGAASQSTQSAGQSGCRVINVENYPNGIYLGDGNGDCVSFTLESGQVTPWIHLLSGRTYNISIPSGNPSQEIFTDGSTFLIGNNSFYPHTPGKRVFELEAFQDDTTITVSIGY